jgi:hypothetical protein
MNSKTELHETFDGAVVGETSFFIKQNQQQTIHLLRATKQLKAGKTLTEARQRATAPECNYISHHCAWGGGMLSDRGRWMHC